MTNSKISKLIISIIISILLIFSIIGNVSADVGSFESYDSGSSWDSSDSWGSSSSWSSSGSSSSWDWDDDDYYSSGSSRNSKSYTMVGNISTVILMIFTVIIVVLRYTNNRNKNIERLHKIDVLDKTIPQRPNSRVVLRKIQEIDPMFSEEEFIAWSKDLFIKLQNQWMAREWEEIRYFETTELFEQHKNQIQGYIDKRQINMLERICVNYADLYAFRQVGDKDILEIALNSSMVDYIIDEDTKKVLMGDTVTRRTRTYKLTFIRKTGITTKTGEAKVNTTNCPNCGAPTKITSSGKCEYCGSVITTGEFNWVLSNLEPLR